MRKTYTAKTPEEFVAAYLEAASFTELAVKMECTENAVRQRAAAMIKRGVKLQSFAEMRRKIDVEKLNKMIAEKTGKAGGSK